jgi:condensin complex subunit 3
LTLFIHCFSKGHPALQTICLQIITDILVTHPTLLQPSATNPSEDSPHLRPVLKAYTKSLKSPNASVSSTGALALSKTFLSHLLTDSDLLKQLVLAYFDAESASNPHLRQTLAYFLPVYCHSRAENAERMSEIATAVVAKCVTLREALMDDADVEAEGDGADGMVKVGVVGSMLCDWTDPRKIIGADGQSAQAAAGARTHYALAEAILERLVTTQVSKEERKVLFAMLGRLYFPPNGCNAESLKTLLELATEAVDGKVAPDATSRNVLTKMQNQWLKLIGDVMTAERGGGGAEETIIGGSEEEEDVTEVDATSVATAVDEEDDDDDDDAAASQVDIDEQLQREMRDTTIGGATMTTGFGFTTGIDPDAEGTRFEEGEEYTEVEDSEMMEIDG